MSAPEPTSPEPGGTTPQAEAPAAAEAPAPDGSSFPTTSESPTPEASPEPPACDPALLERARAVLHERFGYPDFRPSQGQLVQRVLAGRDVLGVMPTGAGKSLVYQVPALVLGGTTVVISPLISLMNDQVQALEQAGVAAACITSALSAAERSETFERARAGLLSLLYVAPERLDDPGFLELASHLRVPLVAVDEAHCVSQWGQDFRPSYLNIAAFVERLVAGGTPRPIVCALTATATQAVRDDIARGLDLRDPWVMVAGFDRPNLYFGVERPEPRDKAACLLRLVQAHEGQSGIVYCSTRKNVEEVCELLRGRGVPATRYHAGLAPEERQKNQEDFVYDRAPVMVATNAFGMGIDKSNVTFVIHYNMPGDLESYYQEAGRAGRDGSPADCILIYNRGDVQTRQFLLQKSHEDALAAGADPEAAERTYTADQERLRQMTLYCTTTDCLRSTILRYFGETDAPFRCEHCSNCSTDFEVEDATVEAQKVLSCVLRLAQRGRQVGKATVVDVLHGSKGERIASWGLDTLSTYGIMADTSARRIRYVLDALVDAGLLEVSGGQFPVVGATGQTMPFLRERRPFELKVPKRLPRDNAAPSRGAASRRRPATTVAELTEDDQALFERLRSLRGRLAREAGLPAYMALSNATLAEMARKRPTDRQALLEVSGVGAAKAERWGAPFLEEVASYAAGDTASGDGR